MAFLVANRRSSCIVRPARACEPDGGSGVPRPRSSPLSEQTNRFAGSCAVRTDLVPPGNLPRLKFFPDTVRRFQVDQGHRITYRLRTRRYRLDLAPCHPAFCPGPPRCGSRTVSILWGWGAARYPWILEDIAHIDEYSASDSVLWTLVVALAVSTVLVVPSLLWLYRLTQVRALGEGAVRPDSTEALLKPRA